MGVSVCVRACMRCALVLKTGFYKTWHTTNQSRCVIKMYSNSPTYLYETNVFDRRSTLLLSFYLAFIYVPHFHFVVDLISSICMRFVCRRLLKIESEKNNKIETNHSFAQISLNTKKYNKSVYLQMPFPREPFRFHLSCIMASISRAHNDTHFSYAHMCVTIHLFSLYVD